MASPFCHLEILGPRGGLDRWLTVLQDHGGCHVVDALRGLESEPGIGRPLPTPAEREGGPLRSRARVALRAVAPILPRDPGEPAETRPTFQVGPLGEDRADVEAAAEEAVDRARRLRAAQEAARAAVRDAALLDARQLALAALADAGDGEVRGRGYVASDRPGAGRRLVKAFRAAGAAVRVGRGRGATVVVAQGPISVLEAADDAAARQGAQPFLLTDEDGPADIAATRARLEEAFTGARRRETEARAALGRTLEADGPRARHLLDALEDAEARTSLHDVLAATEHVVAARVFVEHGRRAQLERALADRMGPSVVVRPLAPADDEPTLPRSVAGLPLAALGGLLPRRFGDVAPAALLAPWFPLLAGALAADVATGLLLLAAGGLLALGAPAGSPRRDTALLGQLGGLAALATGTLSGRVLGRETAWALGGGDLRLPSTGAAIRDLLVAAGALAGLFALWGALLALLRRGRGDVVGARSAGASAGTLALVAAAGALAGRCPGVPVAVLAAVGGIVVVASGGLASGGLASVGRGSLDLLGALRLTAVATLGLSLLSWGYTALGAGAGLGIVAGPAAAMAGAFLLVIDPAHVAMGVPYDLSLGSRGLGRPFRPLRRAGAAR